MELHHISQQQVGTAARANINHSDRHKKKVTKANRHLLQTCSDKEIVWDGFRSGDCLHKHFTHYGKLSPITAPVLPIVRLWVHSMKISHKLTLQWQTGLPKGNTVTDQQHNMISKRQTVHRQFALVLSQEWIVRPASCYANLLQSLRH